VLKRLPRWLRGPAAAAPMFVVGLLISQWVDYRGFFASAVGMATDSFLSDTDSDAGGNPVVTIGIDEDDYKTFFRSRSPLAPRSVLALVAALRHRMAAESAAQGPSVLGVDLLTDDNAYRSSVLASNEPRTTPIVWAASAELAVEPIGFLGWLVGGSDELFAIPGAVLGAPVKGRSAEEWGVPVFPVDDDRAVRRIRREWINRDDHDQRYENTLARAVARVYCRQRVCHDHGGAEDLFLQYGRLPPQYTVRDLFECGEWSEDGCVSWHPRSDAGAKLRTSEGSVVLLGGVFPQARDKYPTPIGENTSGLIINALAVRAEIEGPTITEAPRLLAIGLDAAAGVAVSLIFMFAQVSLRAKTLLSLALAVPALVLSIGLFAGFGRIWLGWATMILAGAAWNVVFENLSSHDTGAHGSNGNAEAPVVITQQTAEAETVASAVTKSEEDV